MYDPNYISGYSLSRLRRNDLQNAEAARGSERRDQKRSGNVRDAQFTSTSAEVHLIEI